MKLFEDTTCFAKLTLGISDDKFFIWLLDRFLNFYEDTDSEWQPEFKLSFTLDLGEDVDIEIIRENTTRKNELKLLINNEEIDFEEQTPELILKAIKENIIE